MISPAKRSRSLVTAIAGVILALTAPAASAGTSMSGPTATTIVTRTASCSAHDFRPIDSDVWYAHESGLRRLYKPGYALCAPHIPDKAVVRRVRFTLRDTTENEEVRCGLFRAALSVSALGVVDELASVPPTGITATPGRIRSADTTIFNATIDMARFGYWLQCELGGNDFDVARLTGIYGADVQYTLAVPDAGTNRVTRSAACHGWDFVPDSDVTASGRTGLLRTLNGVAGSRLGCALGLPDGAIVTSVQFTRRDDAADTDVRDCALRRGGLSVASEGSMEIVGAVPHTGLGATPGVARAASPPIGHATIDNARWGYWVDCLISKGSTAAGIYGANIIYTIAAREAPANTSGGPAATAATAVSRSFSCVGTRFERLITSIDTRYYGVMRQANGAVVCRAELPHGASVTTVRFTVRDSTSSGEVRFCALARGGLRAATAEAYGVLAEVPGTGAVSVVGTVRQTDSTIVEPIVDNIRYAYFLQCEITSGPTDLLGLYGATVTYTVSQ